MKDKITLKKVLIIIGIIVLVLLLSPFAENLIYQSRYKNEAQNLAEIINDDFDMNINKFNAATTDGFVDVDILKKNSKWKYAEVQVIDKDGYIIHREYQDLSEIEDGKKFNLDFGYRGEDGASLNIVGSNEIKEKDTTINRLKNKTKDSKIYKSIEDFYNKNLKGKFKISFNELKMKIYQIPNWIKVAFGEMSTAFYAIPPGVRALAIIFFARLFI